MCTSYSNPPLAHMLTLPSFHPLCILPLRSLTINADLAVSIFVCSFEECFCLVVSQISALLGKAFQNVPGQKNRCVFSFKEHATVCRRWTWLSVKSVVQLECLLVCFCVCKCLTWAHLPLWSRCHPHPEPGRPSWRFQPTWLSVPPVRRTFWGQMFLLQKAKTEARRSFASLKYFGNLSGWWRTNRDRLVWKAKNVSAFTATVSFQKLTSGTLVVFPLRAPRRLLQTCKGFKSFLDLLSFQQICHRHFVSWRQGQRDRESEDIKGSKWEVIEKCSAFQSAEKCKPRGGGFLTKAEGQI